MINKDVVPLILSPSQKNDVQLERIKEATEKQNNKSRMLDKQHQKILKSPEVVKSFLKKTKSRKSVKQMVKEYEDNIIKPPMNFQDNYKPIPKPRLQKVVDNIIEPPIEFQDNYKPVPKPRIKTKQPVPYPRTKITPLAKALKSGVETFN